MAEALAALARIGKEDLPCTREEGANRASDLQPEEDVNMANMANVPLAGWWRSDANQEPSSANRGQTNAFQQLRWDSSMDRSQDVPRQPVGFWPRAATRGAPKEKATPGLAKKILVVLASWARRGAHEDRPQRSPPKDIL